MTPTLEVEAETAPTSNLNCGEHQLHCSQVSQGLTHRRSMEATLSHRDLDNRCSGCLCSQNATTSQRPDASSTFLEVMGKLKSERAQTTSKDNSRNAQLDNVPHIISPPSSPPSPSSTSSTSLFNKLKSAFKSTSSTSSLNSPSGSGRKKLTASGSSKASSSRRPASFGGADVIKPWTGRRCSQSEKRVSWADELGSKHTLISVRFIKPRLSAPSKLGRPSTPGHSILRNTGLH